MRFTQYKTFKIILLILLNFTLILASKESDKIKINKNKRKLEKLDLQDNLTDDSGLAQNKFFMHIDKKLKLDLASGNLDGQINKQDNTNLISSTGIVIPGLQQLIAEYADDGYLLDKTLTDNTDPVVRVSYSHNNKHLASSSWDHTIKIFDINDNYKLLHNIKEHNDLVNTLVYSTDNKYLVSSSNDGIIKIFDVNNNYALVRNLTCPKDYPADFENECEFFVRSVACSHDNKHLAAAMGGSIKIWDATTYDATTCKVLYSLTDPSIHSLAYSFDNKYLASIDENYNLEIRDVNNNYKLLYNYCDEHIDYNDIRHSVKYSYDNKYLASASWGNTIKIFDVNNNHKLLYTLNNHTAYVTTIEYSRDNKYLFSGSDDATIKIWDVNNNYKLLHTIEGSQAFNSLACSPDNKYLASCFWGVKTINIYKRLYYFLLQQINEK